MDCCICGNSEGNKIHTAHELLLGLSEHFKYLECGACNCIQLLEPPEDMSKYYPPGFFSGAPVNVIDFDTFDKTDEQKFISWASLVICPQIRGFEIKSFNHSILDIDCKNGQVARTLGAMGFKKVVGIDKELAPINAYEAPNCKIYKGDFFDIDETYDFIMINNTIERLGNQKEALLKIRDIMSDDGVCFITMPIATYAWHLYGTSWVQLDAPRNLIVHSYKSLDVLLRQTGFKIKSYRTQSTNTQFILSEMYKKGISWTQYVTERLWENIPKKTTDRYAELAKKLDEKNQGDQLLIYIEKDKEAADV